MKEEEGKEKGEVEKQVTGSRCWERETRIQEGKTGRKGKKTAFDGKENREIEEKADVPPTGADDDHVHIKPTKASTQTNGMLCAGIQAHARHEQLYKPSGDENKSSDSYFGKQYSSRGVRTSVVCVIGPDTTASVNKSSPVRSVTSESNNGQSLLRMEMYICNW